MKSARKIFLLLVCLTFFIVGVLIIFNRKAKEGNPNERKTVKIRDIKILVELAETQDEKAKGLSGRKTLDKNGGLLFVFAKDTRPTFWMKDMNFPLDIIWINDGKITQIDKNIPSPSPGATDSQLPLYSPKEPIDYVLEVNAGFSEKNNFQVGDLVDLSQL